MHEKVTFSFLKTTFSALKVTFSRLKVTFSDEFSRKLEAKGHLFQKQTYLLVSKGQL